MAIDRTGISSLQTGAPEIKYTGTEGPQDPRAMTDIDKIILQHWIQQGGSYGDNIPEEFKQQIIQIYGLDRDRSASGGIARLGLWNGGPPGGGATAHGSGRDVGRGAPSAGVGAQAPTPAAVVAAAKDQAEEEKIARILNNPRISGEVKKELTEQINMVPDTIGPRPVNLTDVAPGTGHPVFTNRANVLDYSTIDDFGYDYPEEFPDAPRADPHDSSVAYYARQPGIEISGSEKAKQELRDDIRDLQDIVPPGSDAQDYVNIYRDPSLADVAGGGAGLDDTGITGTNIPGTPIVPTGLTAAESAQAFEDAKAAAIAEAQAAATTRGLPFEHYYVGGDPTPEQEKFMREHQAAASMVGREAWPAAQGGRIPAAFGGIMDSATGRRAYGFGSIGKIFKKAAKAVKKIAKSPIGKAALIGALGYGTGIFGAGKGAAWKKFLPKLIGSAAKGTKAMPGHGELFKPGTGTGWLGKLLLEKGADKWSLANLSPMKSIGLMSMLPFLTQEKEKDTDLGSMDYGEGLDLLGLRKKILAKKGTREEFPYLNPDYYATAAQGGRIGYQYAGPVNMRMASHPVNDQILENLYEEHYDRLKGLGHNDDKIHEIIMDMFYNLPGAEGRAPVEETGIMQAAKGGRIGYAGGLNARMAALNQLYGINNEDEVQYAQEGGLMDLGGMEKDYREEGGFVPIGGQERADDVPARLSKNEFVFTADAVRAAGGGDIDKGAEVMENVMDNLEQGGQVSQESQGLEGARNMFATAQRLEGVL